jgi:hypothetical protein
VKPTVLVAATTHWLPTARLAMALANAGFTVEALCPPRHPVGKTSAVTKIHTYHGLKPLQSFADAITATKPDLIVPCDDLATRQLHELHNRGRRIGQDGASICSLIEYSLGAPQSFAIVDARTSFMELAKEGGVRVPKTEVIANSHDVRKWIGRMGLPTVLKANGTSSGEGVRIVHTLEEAQHAFRVLHAPPLLPRAAKWAVLDTNRTLVWPSLLRRRYVVNAQAFVAGRDLTSLIACWKGSVLAALHFEVINKQNSAGLAGPSSVVRLIKNAEISAAVEKVVLKLNLSGLHGFDFMLEANTGNAYLIEINPRATQVGHLTLGPGRDLPAALYAAVSGEAVREAPKVTENDTIALFPQEWTRDPGSAFLQLGYHDVPWEERELVRTSVRRRRDWSAWYSKRKRSETSSPVRLPHL